MKRRGVFLVVVSVLLALVIGSNIASGQRVAEDRGDSERFNACVAREKKISALILIDESVSLDRLARDREGTDPQQQRVTALKAVVQSLTRHLTQLDGEIDVQVAISGFGTSYYKRIDWTSLTEENVQTFENEIAKSGSDEDRFNDRHTRYQLALSGAINQFREVDEESPTCRELFWFSDGQHDDDDGDPRKFSTSEENQIRNEICGEGQLADQLRTQGIKVHAVGLALTESSVGLMNAIAERDARYSLDNFEIPKCGTVEPYGEFLFASDASKLLDAIWDMDLPGQPNAEVELSECTSAEGECKTTEFTVDSTVRQFRMSLSRPDDQATVELGYEVDGKPTVVSVFGATEPTENGLLRIRPWSSSRAEVEVTSQVPGDISGRWWIRSVGPSSENLEVKVRFMGGVAVKVLDEVTQEPVNTLNRPDGTALTLTVDTEADSEIIQQLDVKLQVAGGTEAITPINEGNGKYSIAAGAIKVALASPLLESVSNLAMEIQPFGFIGGLKKTDGSQVEVEYEPTRISLSIDLGDEFPQFVGTEGGIRPKVKNNDEVNVVLLFRGPDTGDGSIEFEKVLDNDFGFDFVGVPTVCLAKEQTEVKCPVVLKPKRDGADSTTLSIQYVPTSIDLKQEAQPQTLNEAEPQILNFEIAMTRTANAGRGAIAFVEYLAIFLAVLALVRFFFAFLLARFSALESTARRVRIPVSVDADGAVNAPSGRFIADVSDGAFAFEVTEPQRSFSMFGYDFTSSVWKTFRGSTTTPLGRVSQYGTFIFGSRGVEKPRKQLSGQGTKGLIDLSLRSQWVLAIANSEMARLANEGGYVDGEIVAFLDPFESSELSGQLPDLEFAVAGSSIASDVRDVLEQLKVADVSENNDLAAATTPDDPFDISPSSVDPFSTEPFSEQADSPVDGGGGRKRFRKKDKGEDPEPPPASPDPFDPFV